MKPNDRWMAWVLADSARGVGPLPFQRGHRPVRRAAAAAPPAHGAGPIAAATRPLPRPSRVALTA